MNDIDFVKHAHLLCILAILLVLLLEKLIIGFGLGR